MSGSGGNGRVWGAVDTWVEVVEGWDKEIEVGGLHQNH
jgi:hypothetical protein